MVTQPRRTPAFVLLLGLVMACLPALGEDPDGDEVVIKEGAVLDAGTPEPVVSKALQATSFVVTFGHRGERINNRRVEILANSPGMRVTSTRASRLESGETLLDFSAGAGDVDGVTVSITWPTSSGKKRAFRDKSNAGKPIWDHVFKYGTPDQVERLLEDPGMVPDAPVVTIQTAGDGTRGFSIGIDLLLKHKAMWFPEHDAFITLADDPVDFEKHESSLTGTRVLDEVKSASESSLKQFRDLWPDYGNVSYDHSWETDWMGSTGHLIVMVAEHGSLFKFCVDRWSAVIPDFASPHKFRFAPQWQDSQWESQRIINGLPVVETVFSRNNQTTKIIQFAASLESDNDRPRGGRPTAMFSKFSISGAGPVQWMFSFDSYSDDIKLAYVPSAIKDLESVDSAASGLIVNAETKEVWMSIDAKGMKVRTKESSAGRILEIAVEGVIEGDNVNEIEVRIASPAVAEDNIQLLQKLDFESAKQQTIDYWERWIARGAVLEVPEKAVNDLARAAVWHALSLPRHRTDEKGFERIDLPYSNVAYGQTNADWPMVQEVYVDYMIHGLMGNFDIAESEIVAINQTQMRHNGRIGGYAEWGVYSPAHLYTIAQLYLLSQDREMFERLLPNALKTLDYVLDEVAKESRSGGSGLIDAPINDLTHSAHKWGFPNGYFVAGMEMFGKALELHGHPRADEVCAAAKKMKADLAREFARGSVKSAAVRLRDNTWSNYVPSAADIPRRLFDEWYPTDVDCGPLHMSRLAALDPSNWLTTAMLNDHEDNMFLLNQGASNEPVYNQQASAYLYRDEPKAVIRSFYSFMACAFSFGQLAPLEHLYAHGQYSGPPSTTGSWYEQLRRMIVGELGDCMIVGQAIPRAWLEDRKTISLKKAQTYSGPVDLNIKSAADEGLITTELTFLSERRPARLLVRVRHPLGKLIAGVTVNGVPSDAYDVEKEWVVIDSPTEDTYTVVTEY